MAGENLKVLIGWKEISSYLNCSRSTAVRRLKDGLPVFRVGGSVRAFAADIDRWLEGERLRKLESPDQTELELPPDIVHDDGAAETIAAYVRDGKGQRYAVVPLGIDTSEFERIEKRLQTAEEKSRWVLETIPVWVWETNAEGEYTYSNVASLDILGYRPEELSGFKPVDFLVHKEDKPLYEGEVGKLTKKQAAVRGLRCRFLNRDDEVRWLEVDAEPVFDPRGVFAGVRGVSRDVTARVRAEEKEREHLESLSFLSGSAMAFVGFNPDKDLFSYVADKLRALLGGTVALMSYDEPTDKLTVRAISGLGTKAQAVADTLQKDPLGLTFPTSAAMKNLLYSGKLRKHGAALNEMTAGSISKRAERKLKQVLSTDHLYFMGIVRHDRLLGAAAIIPPPGAELRNPNVVEAFIAQAGVALQRKYAEEAQRESEEKYRRLVDQSLVGLYITQNHTLKFCNRRFVEIFGYDNPEELVGKQLRDFVAPGSWKLVYERAKLRESGRKGTAHYVFKGLKKDGTPFDVETLGARIIYEGRPAIQGGMIDITDRKRAEVARERERAAFRIIAECAVEADDTPTLCRRVTEGLVAALGFDFGTVELFDAERGLLYNGAVVGLTRKQIAEKEGSVPLGDDRHVSAHVGLTRNALFVPDVKGHPIADAYGDWLEDLGVRGFISWPLVGADEQLLGVLQLGGRTPKTVAEGDQIFFATVAGMFATALERRRADEALRRSEEFNRAVIERSPLGISVRDRNGRLLNFNEEWRKTWACSDEDIERETRDDRKELQFNEYDEYLDGWFGDVRRVYREGGYLHLPELEVVAAREGGARWVNHYFYAIKGPAGEVERVVILTEDITERKQAEELAEVQRELAQALAGAATLEEAARLSVRAALRVSAMDAGGMSAVDPSVGAGELVYYEGLETEGAEDALRYDGDSPEAQAAAEGRPAYTNYADSPPRTAEAGRREGFKAAGIIPVMFERDLVACLRVASRNVSEVKAASRRALEAVAAQVGGAIARIRAAEALARANEDWERTFNAVPDLIALVDDRHRIIRVNRATAQRYGLTAEECIGRTCFELLHGTKEPPEYCPHAKLLRDGREYEAEFYAEPLGAHLVVTASPISDAEGRLAGSVHVARDVTARKMAEEARERKRKAVRIIAEATVRPGNLRELCRYVVAGLAEALGFEIGSVRLCDEKTNALQKTASYGLTRDEVDEYFPTLPLDDRRYFSAFVARTGKPIFAPDVTRHDVSKTHQPRVKELGIGALLSWPILDAGGGLLGVINLASRKRKNITEEDRAAFETVVEIFATAIERRRAEETIRRSEAKHRLLLESLGSAVLALDKEMNILYFNEAYAASVGRRREEMEGRNLLELFPGLTEAESYQAYEQALSTGTPQETEGEFRGSYLNWMVYPMPWGILVIASDITERKSAERALQESETRFRSVFEASPMGMHLYELKTDGDLIFIGGNRAASELLGADNEDLVGKTIEETFPALAATEDAEKLRRAAEHGEPWMSERIEYEGGQIKKAYVVQAFQSSPGKTVAAFAEITERKRMEKALQDSEQRHRALFDSGNDAIFVFGLNEDGSTTAFTDVNDEACARLGYGKSELLKMTPADITTPENKPHTVEKMGELLQFGEAVFEWVHVTKSGKRIPVEINSHLFELGRRPAVFSIARDITTRKYAEEALKKSEERYRALVGGLPVGVFRARAGGEIVSANEAALRILGFASEDDIKGRSAWDISLNSQGQEGVIAKLEKEGAVRTEVLLDRDGGAPVKIMLDLHAEFDDADEFSFVNVIVQEDVPTR